jgi:hypothetical protein
MITSIYIDDLFLSGEFRFFMCVYNKSIPGGAHGRSWRKWKMFNMMIDQKSEGMVINQQKVLKSLKQRSLGSLEINLEGWQHTVFQN